MPVVEHTDMQAIRRVLAAYRSTEAHITEAEITAAWSEFEALREAMGQDHRGRSAGAATVIGSDDSWPVAVSDGVGLACSDCGQVPTLDYHVTDGFWRQWVPEKPARLGVVCLQCLDRRSGGLGLAEALTEIQWTGTGHTVVLHPVARYDYKGRSNAR